MEQRQASRLILPDGDGRVLLLRHRRRDGSTFWAAPGGGVQSGETFEQAALREAAEELGATGRPVKFLWEGASEFMHVAGKVQQREQFFLLDGAAPAPTPDLQATWRAEGILEARWWTLAEIESAQDVFPENLAAEVNRTLGIGARRGA